MDNSWLVEDDLTKENTRLRAENLRLKPENERLKAALRLAVIGADALVRGKSNDCQVPNLREASHDRVREVHTGS